MQLFYNPEILETTKEIMFDKVESAHIVRVLRKKESDILHITNGKGFLFDAKIVIANDKKCLASIIKTEQKPKPWNYYLHIAIAPTKNNDRIEWFLEKATEIGIDEITPIICDHSERKVIKPERYEKIIQSAMKQSLKAYLPQLNPAISFKDFVEKNHSEKNLLIAHCEDTKKESLKNIIHTGESSLILIGPEGDFSLSEIEMAINKHFKPITLGASRLRTETAAVVACHSVSFIAN